MPPSATVASDWVRSLKPLAFTSTSTPLACQKRVLAPTNFSYGVLTKTRRVTPLPSSSSAKAATWPTLMRRKYSGLPMSSEPILLARSTNCRPEASRVTMGATSSPVKVLRVSSDVPASARI